MMLTVIFGRAAVAACFIAGLVACGGGDAGVDPVTLQPVPPTITSQPANQSVLFGTTATFTVVASGDSPLAYQWQRNGLDVAHGNSSTFTLSAGAADHASAWAVRVSNPAGSVLSTTATLSVNSGTVTLVAGSVVDGGSNDGQGAAARFSLPHGLAVDSGGNVFVVDAGNNEIRKISPSGLVTTFAGQLGPGASVNGVGTDASFSHPGGMAIDNMDNLYVVDAFPNFGFAWQAIRKISPAGVVTRIDVRNVWPAPIAVDTAGNAYLSRARKVAPDGSETFFNADGFRYLMASIAVDRATGAIFYGTANSVRRTMPGQPEVILAGSPTGEAGAVDGIRDQARFNFFSDSIGTGMVVDSVGNVYLTEDGNNAVRKVTPAGVVTTVADRAGVKTAQVGLMPGQFSRLRGLALQGDKILYVTSGNAVLKIELP